MKERTLDMAVDFVIAARKESANGRIKRDTMFDILKGMPPEYTRDMIYNREKKRRRIERKSSTPPTLSHQLASAQQMMYCAIRLVALWDLLMKLKATEKKGKIRRRQTLPRH
jgi:hypothetical protein